MNERKQVSIGDLAEATGTKVVTVRYYERIGLLPVPSRTAGNYRVYGEGHIRQMRFIRRCRDLGFTLNQVRELLQLSSRKNQACTEVARITAGHLSDVREKLADLTRLAKELDRLNKSCKCDGSIADCRIIDTLAPD